MRNKILAILFSVIIITTAIGQKSYDLFGDILQGILSSEFKIYGENVDRTDVDTTRSQLLTSEVADLLSSNETSLLDALPYKTNMVRLNGSTLKKLNVRSYYNQSYGMNITTSGYNIGRYNQTTTDYEVGQMVLFKEYLDSKGINLLYVSEPAKYIDDDYYTEQFGGKTYLNENTDLFLERLDEYNIDYLDLRDEIVKDDLDSMSLFYRTDHHWTVPASLWAARKISEKLNDDYDYKIDLKMFSEKKYNSVLYKDAWLGEQGRLVSDSYIGLDDYTMMKPNFDTSYTVISDDDAVVNSGDFGIFINTDVYTSGLDVYSSTSWHYSYSDYNYDTIHNNYVDYGNVLVLGDSYESSMAPFLSLGIQNMKVVIPREFIGQGITVRDYVESGDYDTVIIAYAQFMIGAHDNPSNANYNMFNLE